MRLPSSANHSMKDAPWPPGAAGRFDRVPHIGFVEVGDFGDHLGGSGILHREARARPGAAPFAVDIGGVANERVVVEFQHREPFRFRLVLDPMAAARKGSKIIATLAKRSKLSETILFPICRQMRF